MFISVVQNEKLYDFWGVQNWYIHEDGNLCILFLSSVDSQEDKRFGKIPGGKVVESCLSKSLPTTNTEEDLSVIIF